MVQRALNNIANRFYLKEICSIKHITEVLKIISNEMELKKTAKFDKVLSKIEYDKHFEDIEIIRKYLTSLEKYNSIEIENKINYFLSLFLPTQDELNKLYTKVKNPYDLLKSLSLLSYYIKKDKNDKNIVFDHKTNYGNLRISINKAKPEKIIDQIIDEKNSVNEDDKPKCAICIENIGYKSDGYSDSRENLRVHFENMYNDEKWFLQFSPYAYLNNHFVINSIEHTPMKISSRTLENLLIFIKRNPNFFLGSNADLPIVGGSLLDHDYYQGGEDKLPLMDAKVLKKFEIDNATISILNWPLNTVKISSKQESEIYAIGNFLINNWKHYDLKDIENINNNSTTIILNKTKEEGYNLFLIFRNNSISQSRPYGNFHFHQDKFNINQENIGLMEAAGLAILPQRLEKELLEIVDKVSMDQVESIEQSDHLQKHYKWIKSLLSKKLQINEKTIFKYAADVFASGLEDCKVLEDEKFITYITNLLINNKITLKNNTGLKVEVLKEGFTIKNIYLNNEPFLLEYEKKSNYFSNSILLNSFVGPIAGRIEKDSLVINNNILKLPCNNNNFLHSMEYNMSHISFNFKNEIDEFEDYWKLSGKKSIHNNDLNTFYHFSINLKLYKNINKIDLTFKIQANNDFIANPTQHFYFCFPTNQKITDYTLNLDNKDSVWYLSDNMNPYKMVSLNLEGDSNTIASIANQLDEKQHNIIGGLIDHPFVTPKRKLKLGSNQYQINLSSEKMKEFVLYTHNFASVEKLINPLNKSQKNCGVCIEFQYAPLSKQNNNIDLIHYTKDNYYKNTISIEINKK